MDTFLLLANPNATAAQVRATFFTAAGEALARDYVIPAMRRLDVWINQIPELASASFATLLQTTNGVSFVAERSVYWGDAAWTDGHVSLGETSVGFLKWAFAEGQQGGPLAFETYYLLLNVNTQGVDVEATFLREDGTGIVRTLQIPPRARMDLQAAYQELDGQRFALFLRSLNSLKFYAERSVYRGPGWDGGHNAKGREWKWAIGTPPPPPAVDPPVISPPPGTYANAVSVSMEAAPGASVRYTTDGTEPTQSSTLYGGPFLLDGLPTIKARAYAAGFSPSAVTTNSPYTFQVADPGLDPPGGTYTASTSVSATTSTNGAALRYTTDGSTPTESSSLYTSPLPMATMVLKVRAFKPGYSSSNVVAGTYALQASDPAFDPPAGTYAPGQEISLHAETGATVRFTTDGTDPTEGSPAYSSPVTLIADMTMKARAYAPGAAPSEVVSAQYVADCPEPNGNDTESDTAAIQCLLDQGGTIVLDADVTQGYLITDPGLVLAHHGTILEGASAYEYRALLIADAHLQQPILRVEPGTTGYRIANVWFYGNKWNRVNPYCADHRVVNLRLFGSGFVVDNIESDTAPCQTSTTVDGGPFEIMNNWFAFNGWPEAEVAVECMDDIPSRCWADGLTVHLCDRGQIHDNHFLDNTDVDLIVGGAYECTVEDNTIVHSGTYGFAGLMVGWFPSSVEGIGDGDHTGSLYQRNTVTSSYDQLAFGVMVGFHPWDYRQPEQVTEAGQVVSNTATGAVVNLAVDGIDSGTVEANTFIGAQGTNGFGNCMRSGNYTAADFGAASLQTNWVLRWYHGGDCSQ